MFTAFNLTQKYRIPVIILGDGILGQMMEPITANRNEGRLAISDKQKPWALTGCKGRKQNIVKSFYMREGDLEKFNLKLQKKYAEIMDNEQRLEEIDTKDAEVILVAYGTMARIVKSAVKSLRAKGIKAGLIRPITLWPFPVNAFKRYAAGNKRLVFLAVEMSYGQMVEDVRLAVCASARVEFLGRSGGGIPTEEEIIKKVTGL